MQLRNLLNLPIYSANSLRNLFEMHQCLHEKPITSCPPDFYVIRTIILYHRTILSGVLLFWVLHSITHNIKQLRVRTYSFPVLTRSYYFVQTRFNISIYFNISFVVVSGSSCSFINPTNVNSSIFESLSTSKVGYNLVVSAFSKIE